MKLRIFFFVHERFVWLYIIADEIAEVKSLQILKKNQVAAIRTTRVRISYTFHYKRIIIMLTTLSPDSKLILVLISSHLIGAFTNINYLLNVVLCHIARSSLFVDWMCFRLFFSRSTPEFIRCVVYS